MDVMGTNVASVEPIQAATTAERLRVLLVAPPMVPVPPPTYAGTERVVAAGDSVVPYEHIPTVEQSLWATGYRGDVASYMQHTIEIAWREAHRFDIVHAHMENHSFVFAEHCETPVITTLHGRLDAPGLPELLEVHGRVPLVAISESQRRWFPDQHWVATIHHGLPLETMPFSSEPGDYLAFVGRITPEKGIRESIELSRLSGLRLKVAAKVLSASEHAHYDEVVQPAIDADEIDYLGEVGPRERDPLFAGALATLMLGSWPEPFGLVAIESMATVTPVIARRAGALTETIEHGVTGFIVDDVEEAALAVEKIGELDRHLIRERALERFSPQRMADEYEMAYRQVLASRPSAR